MRILVDQNAPRKYVEALRRDDSLIVITAEEALRHDATDAKIAQFAESNGWVVFTNDDDFFVAGGDVVAGVKGIGQAYQSHSEIVESVPGGWLSR